jgi:hypothetical protein
MDEGARMSEVPISKKDGFTALNWCIHAAQKYASDNRCSPRLTATLRIFFNQMWKQYDETKCNKQQGENMIPNETALKHEWSRDQMRFEAAKAAMRGLLSLPETTGNPEYFARWSVLYADALLAELEKPVPGQEVGL